MIVVDTEVIAFFWLETARSEPAVRTRRLDPDWIAPVLWRSEFRSVLRQHILADLFSYRDAAAIAAEAELDMQGREYEVDTAEVLRLAARTERSSYDCEYVALARTEGVSLVTGDRALARRFPETAVLLEEFAVM